MRKGLLYYLTQHVEASESQEPIFEETTTDTTDIDSLDSSFDLIEPLDRTIITGICTSYIESYESGELTFNTAVKLSWMFLDDYEPRTEDVNAFHAYKSEILYELLEHIVTLKPSKGTTRRPRIGTPPPKVRQRLPFLIDSLIARNEDLRKLPVDSLATESQNNNVFEVVAVKLQRGGFPKTTAKMVSDIYYDKSSKD